MVRQVPVPLTTVLNITAAPIVSTNVLFLDYSTRYDSSTNVHTGTVPVQYSVRQYCIVGQPVSTYVRRSFSSVEINS